MTDFDIEPVRRYTQLTPCGSRTSLSKCIGRRPSGRIHNPTELMFFTRWSSQPIGTVFIFFRKIRPSSQLHRPDTETSQIAEVHLSYRIFQDEERVRDGEHIVGADSTLHYPAFFHQTLSLQNHSKILQGRACTNRVLLVDHDSKMNFQQRHKLAKMAGFPCKCWLSNVQSRARNMSCLN